MKRSLLSLLAVSSLAYAAEAPSCYITSLALQSASGQPINQIRLQFKDQSGTFTNYVGGICIDTPSHVSATNCIDNSASPSGTFVYNITNATFGTGAINPEDGNPHIFYFSMVTNTMGTLTNCTNDAWPFQWNVAAGAAYSASLPVTTTVSAQTPSNTGVIANALDPYSVGASGTTICTVAGTPVKDDGVVGYWVHKYSVPCGNVHLISLTVANTVSKTTMGTAYVAMSPGLSGSEQYLAVGWGYPHTVTGINSPGTAGTLINTFESMCAYFAYAGQIIVERTITVSSAVNPGQPDTILNPYFQTQDPTPFTTFGIRPTVMLAWGVCNGTPNTQCSNGSNTGAGVIWSEDITTAKARIDQAFAARQTNPNGGKFILSNNTGDITRSQGYFITGQGVYGSNTGIAPSSLNVVASNVISVNSVVATGILYYEIASPGAAITSAPAFISPGAAYFIARTSASGALDGVNQTPAWLYTLYGAAGACGAAEEPSAAISTKYPDPTRFISELTNGSTFTEAAWRSTRFPNIVNCVGDGFAQPFSLNSPATNVSTAIVMGALN